MAATFDAKPERFFFTFASLVLMAAVLYLAQPVFAPLAVALLLTFILVPVVSFLQRRGLPRILSVLAAVLLVFVLLGIITTVVGMQLQTLGTEIPAYRTQIEEKFKGLKEATTNSWVPPILDFINNTTKILNEQSFSSTRSVEPIPVKMEPSVFPVVRSIAGTLLEFLISAAAVFILAVFMLAQREDLRNRVIRLAGHSNLSRTTKVLDDASRRISRFLFSQLMLNTSFGIVVGLGLYLIGIPYAVVWGALTAVLRYVPYLGGWLSAFLPLMVSLVMPGWGPFFMVAAYFAILELIQSNAIEPIVYGHSIGVSGLALLIAALAWTWLWGPLGLVLSTPLTACIVVFARHVPRFQFISIALSDEPVMKAPTIFYQRLLAKDPEEASDLAEDYLKDHSVEQVYQDMLVPALLMANRDREEARLLDEDRTYVIDTVRDILNEVVLPVHPNGQSTPTDQAPSSHKIPVITVPARDDADVVALEMFDSMLDHEKFQPILLSPHTHQAEAAMSGNGSTTPPLILLATLSSDHLVRTRILCHRLHSRFPKSKIVVGCWGLEQDISVVREKLKAAGADAVATTLQETQQLLSSPPNGE